MTRRLIKYTSALMVLTLACSLFTACGCRVPGYLPPYSTSENEEAELSSSDIESPLEDESESDGSDIAKVETKTASDGSIQVIIEHEDGTTETQTYATKEDYEQAVQDGTVPTPLSDADSKVSTKEPSKEASSSETKPSKKDPEKENSSEPETFKPEKESSTAATQPESSSATPQTSAPEPSTQAPETQAPSTQAPETQAPTTQAPETQAPTTQAPETQPPETTAAPHNHSYTNRVTKQPTCQETGVKTYTCSCGDSYTEAIPKMDHNYVEKKEEITKTVTDSEGFTIDVGCCIPRYCASYTHNEDGSWDFLGTWEDTVRFGVPQTEWFYTVAENYMMANGHNTNELIAYMRNAGYRYIYTVNGQASDACDRWLRCIGEFSDGPKNPDHGFREHYGPNWWVKAVDITVPAVTHQETVTNTYYECSMCGQRQ